jgi:hypothetical protein
MCGSASTRSRRRSSPRASPTYGQAECNRVSAISWLNMAAGRREHRAHAARQVLVAAGGGALVGKFAGGFVGPALHVVGRSLYIACAACHRSGQASIHASCVNCDS